LNPPSRNAIIPAWPTSSSATKSDCDWAFWLAAELKELGHAPHIHEWGIKSGDDIYGRMKASTTLPTMCTASCRTTI
jgi:hypothetical protein